MARKQTLQGGCLMLWIEGDVIPLSTSCKIQIQNEISDDGTKDDGEWDHAAVIAKNWSCSNDARLDVDGDVMDFIMEYSGTAALNLIIGIPSNYNKQGVEATDEGVWTEPDGDYVGGNVVLDNVEFAGDKGDWATATVSFKGVGELQYYAATSPSAPEPELEIE